MSSPIRIRIDRLVLDGLAPGTSPGEVDAALRRELARQLAGVRPTGATSVPRLDLTAPTNSPGAAATEVAGGIARTAGKRS
jgi:hypothetical protein